jgi:hypothetical protein
VGSTAEIVLFTLNFGVVSISEWEWYRQQVFPKAGVRPNPNIAYGCGWRAHLAGLIALGGGGFPRGEPWDVGGYWLLLRVDRPFDQVADEVLNSVRDYGLPALRAQTAGR